MRYGMLIDLNTCAGCGACVMACKQTSGSPKGVYWLTVLTREEGRYPNAKKRVLPKSCMHCAKAPCIRRCPTGASHRTDEGLVLINREDCIGCCACRLVCPYDVRHYIGNDPKEDPYWGSNFPLTPYEEKKTIPMHDYGKVEKCNFCVGRLGENKVPACVHTCITHCRIVGDIDDPGSDISKAIKEHNAKPLHEEYGTMPSVYYIQPPSSSS